MNVVGKNKKGLYVRIQMWNGAYKQACTVTTFKSLISNMMIGVTEVSLPAKIFENTPMVLLVCFSWTILFSPNGILNYNMVSTSCFLNIGIQIQNENGACPFPNQLHYLQGQEPSWGQELPRWKEIPHHPPPSGLPSLPFQGCQGWAHLWRYRQRQTFPCLRQSHASLQDRRKRWEKILGWYLRFPEDSYRPKGWLINLIRWTICL